MNYINNSRVRSFWKYDLRDESIAAAVAGMSAYTELDRRCIVFTIHLQERQKHEILCQVIFEKTEEFLVRLGKKSKSASYSGLASFIDVNGSKFSGADRDFSQVHCHGCIFLPHGLSDPKIDGLIAELTLTLKHSTLTAGLTKTSSDAIQFARFDRSRTDASLRDWVGYSQKEAARVETEDDFGVFLPFYNRRSYGPEVAKKMVRKRDIVLEVLQSAQSFKIFRKQRSALFLT